MYIGVLDDQVRVFDWLDSPLKLICSYLHLSRVRVIRLQVKSWFNESGCHLSNQDFDLDTVKHFFEHDYHDRGMMKWQGFYLSDHTAALNQQKQQLNEVYVPRPQQSLATITEVLADAYQSQQTVTIQLKTADHNKRPFPDITTLIHSDNAHYIVIYADQFIPLP